MCRKEIVVGATGVKMSRMSAGLAVTYAIMLAFVWATGHPLAWRASKP